MSCPGRDHTIVEDEDGTDNKYTCEYISGGIEKKIQQEWIWRSTKWYANLNVGQRRLLREIIFELRHEDGE